MGGLSVKKTDETPVFVINGDIYIEIEDEEIIEID